MDYHSSLWTIDYVSESRCNRYSNHITDILVQDDNYNRKKSYIGFVKSHTSLNFFVFVSSRRSIRRVKFISEDF